MKKQMTVLSVFFSLIFSVAATAQVSEPKERVLKKNEIVPAIPFEGVESQRIYTDTVLITMVNMEAGKSSRHHNHPDEQIMLFHTGRVNAVVDDRTHEMGPGDILIIPSFIPHHVEAVEESTWTEVHGPGFNNAPRWQ
jgi:quercetin dioxygenase-like cupin family protein